MAEAVKKSVQDIAANPDGMERKNIEIIVGGEREDGQVGGLS